MKTSNQSILKTTFHTAIFIGVFAITSCNQNVESKDTKEIAEEINDAKFSTAKEEDAGFLVSAAEISLEEIQLGQLAQKNSTTPRVIELGKMMETEHTQALKDVQALATKKKITIPTELTKDGKDANDKLKEKFGSEFDKLYCDMMVKGHKDAISKIEKASMDSKDAEIQSWAETLLISLKNHLAHSTACKEECDKMKTKS